MFSRRALLATPGFAMAEEEAFPSWPIFDDSEAQAVEAVIRSGKWGRGGGKQVEAFEAAFAQRTGSAHCLAVANGTSALLTAMGVLDIGPGDEVIVPPYTFIATVNAVLRFHAVPVFADIDPATLQIDPRRVEQQITPRTRAIVMVHMAGGVGELGQVAELAKRRGIPLVEDAAQAHLAEWNKRHVGTLGTLGCFSFQASKNLNAGEGGALLAQDAALAERAYAFHNNSRGRSQPGTEFHYQMTGANLRLTEMQGALLLAQMRRIEKQAERRTQNARRLDAVLSQYPLLRPCGVGSGCTRHAYHLYMFRCAEGRRASLLEHLRTHGISASTGYAPLEEEPFLENAMRSRGWEFAYGKNYFAKWKKRNGCPENRKACGETVWFPQNMLLAGERAMGRLEKAIASWKA
ncbi:MAG: 3-amino-5-hydroxybenzoate synthase [Bryobacter sp.]